jgi:hypothetical protein
MLSCTGCHGIHTAKGDIIFEVEPNTAAVNPRTKKPFGGVTALCLGCHETQGGMGIKPIAAKHSHPYGIKPDPKVADGDILFSLPFLEVREADSCLGDFLQHGRAEENSTGQEGTGQEEVIFSPLVQEWRA